MRVLIALLCIFLICETASAGPFKRFRQRSERDNHSGQGRSTGNAEGMQTTADGRQYILHVPYLYKGSSPAPLVFVFHGGGGAAQGIANMSGMNNVADREGFLVAYPNGTGGGRGGGGGGSWNLGPRASNSNAASKQNVDDIGFVRQMISDISSKYNVDKSRIYTAGLSLGGMFSYRLGCEMTDTFAAMAAVASTMEPPSCSPSTVLPVLHIHGAQDENIPLKGGRGKMTAMRNSWPAPQQGIDFWKSKDQCSDSQEVVYQEHNTVCKTYQGCQAGTEVTFCLVGNQGHGWPGMPPKRWQKQKGVPVNQSFNASEMVWSFFKKHRR